MKMFVPGGHQSDHYPKSLHGIYTSIIPEENEDILSQSPSMSFFQGNDSEKLPSSVNEVESSVYSITDEVRKLGLTAGISNKNKSDYEPYWIEVSPKVRKTRNFSGPDNEKEKLKEETVQGSTSVKPELLKVLKVPQLRSPALRTYPQFEIKDIKLKTSFLKKTNLNSVVKKTKTFESRNENSHIFESSLTDTASICSSIDSINSIDEACFTFYDMECNVFKRNDGLRRTNSEASLRKITDGILLPENMETHSYEAGKEAIQNSDTQTINLRRTASSSDIKKLNNSVSGTEISKAKDGVSKDDSAIPNDRLTFNEDKNCAIAHDDNFPNKHRPRAKSIGVIRWAKSNKVRISKRENNMFSPAAF